MGLSSSLYFIGLMIGSVVTGGLADTWGRRPTLLVGAFFYLFYLVADECSLCYIQSRPTLLLGVFPHPIYRHFSPLLWVDENLWCYIQSFHAEDKRIGWYLVKETNSLGM